MPTWIRKSLLALVVVLIVAALVFAFIPEPVPVDLEEVTRGPMIVSVDEDGKTRTKERYAVSAPLTGRLQRLTLDPGDRVIADETIIAIIDPADPALLDVRVRAAAEARVRAAEATVQQAEAELERSRSSLDFAEDELTKARTASQGGAVTAIELSRKEMLFRRATEEFRSAEFGIDIARFELEQARAALLATKGDDSSGTASERFVIRAPITGSVLRVFQESMAVVAPGTALLELGDPGDIEIVVDVLSTAAVRIEPDDRVIVEHWGGDDQLVGRVRRVEPSAFMKISALGVEEQRVNVIADLVSPFEERPTLGDGFRIEARIVLWEGDDVARVPVSALFRPTDDRGDDDDAWLAFVLEDGRARSRRIRIGHENGLLAEVLDGLRPGDRVIVHPSDQVADGVRVVARDTT